MSDQGVTPSGSGLRPDGLSQSSLSQAEPLVPNAWTVGGTWPYFEVYPSEGVAYSFLGTANDAAVNGEHPSKLAALERLIRNLEDTRRELSGEIARHKLERRRLRDSDTRAKPGDAKQGSTRE